MWLPCLTYLTVDHLTVAHFLFLCGRALDKWIASFFGAWEFWIPVAWLALCHHRSTRSQGRPDVKPNVLHLYECVDVWVCHCGFLLGYVCMSLCIFQLLPSHLSNWCPVFNFCLTFVSILCVLIRNFREQKYISLFCFCTSLSIFSLPHPIPISLSMNIHQCHYATELLFDICPAYKFRSAHYSFVFQVVYLSLWSHFLVCVHTDTQTHHKVSMCPTFGSPEK